MQPRSRRPAAAVSLSHHRLRSLQRAREIAASTGLAPPALVYELGAGEGMLTRAIAERAGLVYAIEIDRHRWLELKRAMAGLPNVRAILADGLLLQFPPRAPFHLVGNVPFGQTAALFRRLVTLENPPRSAHFIVQRDAAQRWAGLGFDSLASITLKARFAVEVVDALHRSDFVPRPNVDSVLLRLTPRRSLGGGRNASRAFEAFVRRGFGQGPTLFASLRGILTPGEIRNSGIDPGASARELDVEDWERLFLAAKRRNPSRANARGSLR